MLTFYCLWLVVAHVHMMRYSKKYNTISSFSFSCKARSLRAFLVRWCCFIMSISIPFSKLRSETRKTLMSVHMEINWISLYNSSNNLCNCRTLCSMWMMWWYLSDFCCCNVEKLLECFEEELYVVKWNFWNIKGK